MSLVWTSTVGVTNWYIINYYGYFWRSLSPDFHEMIVDRLFVFLFQSALNIADNLVINLVKKQLGWVFYLKLAEVPSFISGILKTLELVIFEF